MSCSSRALRSLARSLFTKAVYRTRLLVMHDRSAREIVAAQLNPINNVKFISEMRATLADYPRIIACTPGGITPSARMIIDCARARARAFQLRSVYTVAP